MFFISYTITALGPDQPVEGKVFTHPDYTALEVRMMRFMMLRVCQVLESLHGLKQQGHQQQGHQQQGHQQQGYQQSGLQQQDSQHSNVTELQIREMVEPDGRYHRVLVIRPSQFAQRSYFTVVGFFGQRCFDANDKDSWSRDDLLFSEMQNHQGLLSYSTLELTNGDYCNCILFTDETAKNHWGRSSVHEKAVREFSPTFYHSIRLYNGVLEAPIIEAHKLKLTTVKYFDYSVQPTWMGMRTLE